MLGLLLKPLLALIVGSALGGLNNPHHGRASNGNCSIQTLGRHETLKKEEFLKPRLSSDPNVSTTASLQRDLSSVMADDEMPEAEKAQLFGQTLHKFK